MNKIENLTHYLLRPMYFITKDVRFQYHIISLPVPPTWQPSLK